MAELYRTKLDYHAVEVNQVDHNNSVALAAWCGGVPVVEHDALQHNVVFAAINVPTPNGMMRAQEGDYIVRFTSGSFLCVKENEFDLLFEAVVDG